MTREVRVVAGVLYDGAGRILIAQRPPGKVLAGRWEFPGGKVGDGEAPYDALVRELREELGVEVGAAKRLMHYPVEYADRTVWLDVWVVSEWHGDATGSMDRRWSGSSRVACANTTSSRPICRS
jgi:8-oxo-dGTP diphosphatase